MPGVKHNSAGIQQFLRKTAQVETLRHIAQHLRREVTAIAEMNQPIHGILSWLFLVDTQRATWRSCSAAAGKLRNMAPFKFPNPVNRASSDVLDHIELWIKNTQFSISEAYVELKGFTRSLEKGLPQAWSSYDCLGADTFISLDIVVPSKRI